MNIFSRRDTGNEKQGPPAGHKDGQPVFLLFLAKLVGKAAVVLSRTQSALGRSQTRLLTAAQKRGWTPATEEELNRLSQRQFKLWLYDAERVMARKMARGEPLFETVPKKDEPKTLTEKGNCDHGGKSN